MLVFYEQRTQEHLRILEEPGIVTAAEQTFMYGSCYGTTMALHWRQRQPVQLSVPDMQRLRYPGPTGSTRVHPAPESTPLPRYGPVRNQTNTLCLDIIPLIHTGG